MPVEAPDAFAVIPTATRTRWVPLRAGLINIFQYANEEFIFFCGRLLLNGRNGAGKSMAQETLFPFLLDANMSPSRLSSFTGSSRGMFGRLLGHDAVADKSSVRAYAWLEFGRTNDTGEAEYFTVGAGMDAIRSNESVKPWYWTTSLRVGDTLTLTSPGGEPHSRDNLIKALGADGKVHEGSRPYRTHVNQTLYGLSEDQYNALIALLLELRSPKLAAGLNPDKLANVLRNSLAPVDSAVIDDLAAGFEGIARHEKSLADGAARIQATSALHAAYQKYSRVALKARANAVTAAHQALAHTQTGYDQAQAAHQKALAELEAIGAAQEENRTAATKAESALRALETSDAYNSGRGLTDAQEQASKAAARAETAARHARQSQARAAQAIQRAQAADTQREAAEQATSAARDHLHGPAARLGLTGLIDTIQTHLAGDDPTRARAAVDAAVRDLRTTLDSLTSLHQRATRATQTADDRAAVETAAREALTRATDDAERAAGALEHARDSLAEHAAAFLGTTTDAHDLTDPDTVAQLVAAHARQATTDLHAERAERAQEHAAAAEQLRELTERAEALRSTTVVQLPAPRTPARREPREGAPLVDLIDFTDTLTPATAAAVEAALQAAGLLDAWVTPDGALLPADDTDHALTAAMPAPGASLADVLTPVPGPVDQVTTTAVLRAIAWHDTPGHAPDDSHHAAVTASGHWRLGPLTGRGTKPAAQYIGATARQQQRDLEITDLETTIGAQQTLVQALRTELDRVDGHLRDIDARLATAPDGKAVRAALQAWHIAHTRAEDRRRAAEDAAHQASKSAEDAEAAQEQHQAAATLAGLADAHDTTEIRRHLDEVTRHAGEWLHAHQQLTAAKRTCEDLAELAQQETQAAEDDAGAYTETQQEAAAANATYEALRSTVGADFDQILTEITATKARIDKLRAEAGDLQSKLIRATKAEGQQEAAVAEADRARGAAQQTHESATRALAHAFKLGAVANAGLTPDAVDVDDPASAAALLEQQLSKEPGSPQALERTLNQVTQTHYQLQVDLADDLVIEQRMDDGILAIEARYAGTTLSLPDLAARLDREQDATAQLLARREREVFEKFLAGEVRREVTRRINATLEVLERLNDRMRDCPTASTLLLRLDWQIPADSEDVTADVVELLSREPEELSATDREALEKFFRLKIDKVRAADTSRPWAEQLTEVLDYRDWYKFTIQFRRGGANWQPLTRALHATLSGGEKAVSLYLPMFAAVAAHLDAAAVAGPRIIALDEVFAGVDSKMRGSLFNLMVDFDLDAIVASESETGYHQGYRTATIMLRREPDQPGIHAERLVWDGDGLVEKDEQLQPA